MSNRDDIIARLMKMKALAARGVGGERAAAESLMSAIAEKYGIDLDNLERETESEYPLLIGSGWRLSLFCQIAALMRLEQYGDNKAEHCVVLVRSRYARGRGRNPRRTVKHDRFFRGTQSQFIELTAKFGILSRDYEAQKKAFYEAFLQANDLLLPYGTIKRTHTEKEFERAELAARLATGITPSTIRKMIGDTEAADA